MTDAIGAYETEYNRWKLIEYNGLDNKKRSHLYYVVCGTHAKTGLLDWSKGNSTLEVLRKRAAEAAAARAEESMQISFPDWYESFFEGLTGQKVA